MKIVVLDGYAANPGDLSWQPLADMGELQVHDRTPPDLTVERATDAGIVLTNKTLLGREVIAALPRLKYVGVLATGYDVVDTAAAAAAGVVVTNVPAYSTRSVAQLVFAHLLELCHHVGHHSRTVHAGKWVDNADFCYWDYPLVELAGLAMGVVGFGRIGRAVAELAGAFGMAVLAHDVAPARPAPEGVQYVDLDRLLAESDVVTLHCPLTADTRGLIGASRLAAMKPSAFLINTARGPLVDAAALADALRSGAIAGAGVDVLSPEPPRADNPLLGVPNCHITPHVAWATRSARKRLLDTAIGNLRAFLDGSPRNVVT